MSEADKVHHIVEGIIAFALNGLSVQNPTSVNDVTATCQCPHELQSLRLPQDTRPTQPHGVLQLRALIREIILEELQLHYPPTLAVNHFRTDGPQLRDLVK